MHKDLIKLASAAIIYKELQKAAFLGDLWGMISRLLGLDNLWAQAQNWAAQRDDVSRFQRLPAANVADEPRAPSPYLYNPFTRRMVANERANQTVSS